MKKKLAFGFILCLWIALAAPIVYLFLGIAHADIQRSPWSISVNGEDISDAQQVPSVTLYGNEHLHIVFIDMDGMRHEAWTQGDIFVIQNANGE